MQVMILEMSVIATSPLTAQWCILIGSWWSKPRPLWWQLFRVRLWPARGHFTLILMRLKHLCWHHSPHHPKLFFKSNCTFFPFSICKKHFVSATHFPFPSSVCWVLLCAGEKTTSLFFFLECLKFCMIEKSACVLHVPSHCARENITQ